MRKEEECVAACSKVAAHSRWRVIHAFLVVCALSLVGAFALPGQAHADGWISDGVRDTSWYTSNPNAASYVITTPAQLAGLAYEVSVEQVTFANQTIILGNDIDLGNVDWTPIGNAYNENSNTYFGGVFDGGNHSISGLNVSGHTYSGLFGWTKGATIQNLTVSGSVSTPQWYAAGICAYAEDTNLVNLTNNATIVSGKRAGGVVCTSYNHGNAYYQKLTNKGIVSAGEYHTGGVIGFIYNNGGTASITQCANEGDVYVRDSSEGTADGSMYAVGGVLGGTSGSRDGSYQMSECYNAGNVGASNLKSAGGLVGFLGGAGSFVTYCYNTGAVAGPSNSGGIIGRADVSTSAPAVASCYSSGAASAAIVASSSASSSETASNCYYLEGSAAGAFASGTSLVGSGESKSNADLQSQGILDLLNGGGTSFSRSESMNNGLPVLTWQGNFGKPGQGGIGTGTTGPNDSSGTSKPGTDLSGTVPTGGGNNVDNPSPSTPTPSKEDIAATLGVTVESPTKPSGETIIPVGDATPVSPSVEAPVPQDTASESSATETDAADASQSSQDATASESDAADDGDSNAAEGASAGMQLVAFADNENVPATAFEDAPEWMSIFCALMALACVAAGSAVRFHWFRRECPHLRHAVVSAL